MLFDRSSLADNVNAICHSLVGLARPFSPFRCLRSWLMMAPEHEQSKLSCQANVIHFRRPMPQLLRNVVQLGITASYVYVIYAFLQGPSSELTLESEI